VLGLTSPPPPKDCTRFLKGVCLLNKKGKKCSSNQSSAKSKVPKSAPLLPYRPESTLISFATQK
jgi:hypothetical protein